MRGPRREKVTAVEMKGHMDITQGLLGGEGDSHASSDDEGLPKTTNIAPPSLDLDDSSEDDQIYIAAQQAASNRKTTTAVGKTGKKKSGGFQSLGLNAHLIQAITRKGFTVPTPIQRKTIPLILDGQDVVGMARTGSGKTAAFVIPMLEKLKMHSAKVGARAIILSPSRELALQTLKVVVELSKGTDLRTVLLVGGDSLEEQFASVASNPDIVIATPGRFEHLKVEMRLDLSSIKYVVFDEADRLFEMGFAAQLEDIIHSLPPTRQTHLFSATLPKSLVEFARAGLQDPKLIRLDADSKVSPDLESAFFAVKSQEKEGALLHILQDVIKIPLSSTDAITNTADTEGKCRKRKRDGPPQGHADSPTAHSTIVFAATKHHVEYLANLLQLIGYAVSFVYGSLDQAARKAQIQNFRSGLTNVLVVTDVAARGVDIPILANVVNYDFPPQPKIFVHRVGRTARAGRRGWSYSLVTAQEMPYLLDLQLFLNRKMIYGSSPDEPVNYAEVISVGGLSRNGLERGCEEVAKLVEMDLDLRVLRDVAAKGEKQYLRTRNSASTESAKRAKSVNDMHVLTELHPLFTADEGTDMSRARERMLAQVNGFRPAETVFEVGRRGKPSEVSEIVAKRRRKLEVQRGMVKANDDKTEVEAIPDIPVVPLEEAVPLVDADMDDASENELEITFSESKPSKTGSASWQDSEHFMSYQPLNINAVEDRGYGVHSGSYNDTRGHFLDAARGATMDLATDQDKTFGEASKKATGLRWDKKSKKYVSRVNDEDGSKGKKMIIGENGLKIAASLRSGRFDAWRKANKVERLPRVGDMERPNKFSSAGNTGGSGSARGRPAGVYKHKSDKAPKRADKYRDDYYAKKKQGEAAAVRRAESGAGPDNGRGGRKKSEIKGAEDIRKDRKVKLNRLQKNARPAKPKKR